MKLMQQGLRERRPWWKSLVPSIFALISYGLGTVADRYINTLFKINLACQKYPRSCQVGIQLVLGILFI